MLFSITNIDNIMDLLTDMNYILQDDITMTVPFTSVGRNITFDGNGHTITINMVQFPGLFPNAVNVKNLGIHATDITTLAPTAGWFFPAGTLKSPMNATATNCYSTGPISNLGGGIFGYNSIGISNSCHSMGTIGGCGGGIFGGNSSGTANNCFSTGNMSYMTGSIFGIWGSGIANDCYNNPHGPIFGFK